MSHAHDKLRAAAAEETRYEEKSRLCRDEVAMTGIALASVIANLIDRLGVDDLNYGSLADRMEDRHFIRAADILSDAFCSDAIWCMMRDCTEWRESVRADEDFRAIFEQLKDVGVEK